MIVVCHVCCVMCVVCRVIVCWLPLIVVCLSMLFVVSVYFDVFVGRCSLLSVGCYVLYVVVWCC